MNLQFDLKCSRCGKFHTRLVVIHNNDAGKDTLECLSCLAELLERGSPHQAVRTKEVRE